MAICNLGLRQTISKKLCDWIMAFTRQWKRYCAQDLILLNICSHILVYTLMQTLKCIRSNAYAQMHTYKDIRTKTYSRIQTSKLNAPLVSGANDVLRILASENEHCGRSFTS